MIILGDMRPWTLSSTEYYVVSGGNGMDKDTFFKILSLYLTEFRSVVVTGSARIRYREGEFIGAPDWLAERGYYPTVFRTLSQARFFQKLNDPSGDTTEIWEVETHGKIVPAKSLPPMADLVKLSFGILKPIKEVERWWPEGTVMVEELKLIRKAEDPAPAGGGD
jgi:hypothetical protein